MQSCPPPSQVGNAPWHLPSSLREVEEEEETTSRGITKKKSVSTFKWAEGEEEAQARAVVGW